MKKKVLIVINGDFGTGGQGVAFWNWYKELDLSKLQIDFYCRKKPEDKYIQQIEKNNGKCFTMNEIRCRSKILQKSKILLDLRNILKKEKYYYLHLNSEYAFNALQYYIISHRYIKKIILHSHNSSIRNAGALKKIMHYFSRLFLKGRKCVFLACSNAAAKCLCPKDVYEKREYTIIRNGIETERFIYNEKIRKKVRKELRLDNCFVVGHVGRFVYQKNHMFLIDIFYQIHLKDPCAMLLLVGNGDWKEDLTNIIKDKVQQLGLQDHVIFYGNTDRVNELYQAMDCFVFPSRFEGFGIVALEAQAAGLRVFCSDMVPPETKVTELLEYIPLTLSAEIWANRILSYKNESKKRKNMIEKIINSGYDVKASARGLEEIYLT